jgi:hypothetical protein
VVTAPSADDVPTEEKSNRQDENISSSYLNIIITEKGRTFWLWSPTMSEIWPALTFSREFASNRSFEVNS